MFEYISKNFADKKLGMKYDKDIEIVRKCNKDRIR